MRKILSLGAFILTGNIVSSSSDHSASTAAYPKMSTPTNESTGTHDEQLPGPGPEHGSTTSSAKSEAGGSWKLIENEWEWGGSSHDDSINPSQAPMATFDHGGNDGGEWQVVGEEWRWFQFSSAQQEVNGENAGYNYNEFEAHEQSGPAHYDPWSGLQRQGLMDPNEYAEGGNGDSSGKPQKLPPPLGMFVRGPRVPTAPLSMRVSNWHNWRPGSENPWLPSPPVSGRYDDAGTIDMPIEDEGWSDFDFEEYGDISVEALHKGAGDSNEVLDYEGDPFDYNIYFLEERRSLRGASDDPELEAGHSRKVKESDLRAQIESLSFAKNEGGETPSWAWR
mmetsp:Transcript_64724/g.146016  ORF Transcript_64724/g.146016 Transcript_64724/m.146016 type:complete len:336 (-) Transcript_64724:3-1010(-)